MSRAGIKAEDEPRLREYVLSEAELLKAMTSWKVSLREVMAEASRRMKVLDRWKVRVEGRRRT